MAGGLKALLEKRLGRKSGPSKMTALAKRSGEGQLSSFSGVFGVCELSEAEKGMLQEILLSHSEESSSVTQDLEALVQITSEVKAINNQAALLHGERIKRAHSLLTKYKEGAFTAWLIETYGNRQTPYNFLQYYDFYNSVPEGLVPKLEQMPRQAIYTLAARKGEMESKLGIVSSYEGESKRELLEQIRDLFPLPEEDKRKGRPIEKMLKLSKELKRQLGRSSKRLTPNERTQLLTELDSIMNLIKG